MEDEQHLYDVVKVYGNIRHIKFWTYPEPFQLENKIIFEVFRNLSIQRGKVKVTSSNENSEKSKR